MKELSSLRAEIDQLDEQLWEIIGKRADVVRQVGEWKRQHGEQVVQSERREQVLTHYRQWAQQYGLSEAFAQLLYEAIHNENVRIQS